MSDLRNRMQSEGMLGIMLDELTSGYARQDIHNDRNGLPLRTNIGKLFATFSFGLDIANEQIEKIRLWDDIDVAEGSVLDRHATNFGVTRNGASDELLRLMIKVKMISMLSGGDIDTVILAVSSLFDIPPSDVDLQEIFPANMLVYIAEDSLDGEKMAMAKNIATLSKRIVAAGVGFQLLVRLNNLVFENVNRFLLTSLSIFRYVFANNAEASFSVSFVFRFGNFSLRPAAITLDGNKILDGSWILSGVEGLDVPRGIDPVSLAMGPYAIPNPINLTLV